MGIFCLFCSFFLCPILHVSRPWVYFYRTVLTLLGEQTYSQQMHVDIHAEAAPPKRRRMPRTAIESNDDPDLREGAIASTYRHGVRVIFLDEAHHLLMARDGTQG